MDRSVQWLATRLNVPCPSRQRQMLTQQRLRPNNTFHCCNTGYNNTGRQCTVLVRALTFYYFQTVVDILIKLCFSVVYKLSALTIQQQPCWERSASRRSSVLWLDGAGVLSFLIGWWASGRTYVATLCDCLWFYFEIGNLKVTEELPFHCTLELLNVTAVRVITTLSW